MVANGTGGSVITVLSTAAWQGEVGNIGYCSAKSALINFTRSAATELAPYGIRVNSFTPTATVPADPEAGWQAEHVVGQVGAGSGRRGLRPAAERC